MKIIKNGNKLNRLWISECYSCGAVLTAFEDELNIINGDYRSDYENYSHMICPECKSKTIFYRIDQKTGKILYELHKHHEVVCDDVYYNTGDVLIKDVLIKDDELWCDMYIEPVRTVEFIDLQFIVTKTGVQFNEAQEQINNVVG